MFQFIHVRFPQPYLAIFLQAPILRLEQLRESFTNVLLPGSHNNVDMKWGSDLE